MRKATLDLNEYQDKNRTHDELVGFFNNWETIPSIRLWLKARKFDIQAPIMVTQEKNLVLSFYQMGSDRNLVLIHPNPKILEQLKKALQEPGRTIHTFSKVEAATTCIKQMSADKTKIQNIIVPEKLEVSHNLTFKAFLNIKFPEFNVITVDKKNYRDSVNLRTFKKEL